MNITELYDLIHLDESYRIERTVSTGDMDKFQEAICAFANDLPGQRKHGYLLIGVDDKGNISGLKVDDSLLKRLYQFDDHIEILNPGGLYGQARPENFPNVNDYRNSVLAEMMKTLNYVNMFNHGIREVKSLLAENGNPEPQFKVDYITAFAVEIPVATDDETLQNSELDSELVQKFGQVSDQVKSLIVSLLGNRLPKSELLKLGKLTKSRETLEQNYLNPAIKAGFVTMLYPNNPHHPKQAYYLTDKGKILYEQIKNEQ